MGFGPAQSCEAVATSYPYTREGPRIPGTLLCVTGPMRSGIFVADRLVVSDCFVCSCVRPLDPQRRFSPTTNLAQIPEVVNEDLQSGGTGAGE